MRSKSFVVFLAASASVSHALHVVSDLLQFADYISRFGKSYASGEHHRASFSAFQQNIRLIEAHNAKPEHSYRLGLNKFSDLTTEEFLLRSPHMKKDVSTDAPSSHGSRPHSNTIIRYKGSPENAWQRNYSINDYHWLDN